MIGAGLWYQRAKQNISIYMLPLSVRAQSVFERFKCRLKKVQEESSVRVIKSSAEGFNVWQLFGIRVQVDGLKEKASHWCET